MSEFMYLFRGGRRQGDDACVPGPSPEEMQRQLQAWSAWMKSLTEQGVVRNSGAPLEMTGATVTGKKRAVTDGPFSESKELVCGFIVVEARDLAHAVELSRGCPLLESEHGAVEVRPIIKMNI